MNLMENRWRMKLEENYKILLPMPICAFWGMIIGIIVADSINESIGIGIGLGWAIGFLVGAILAHIINKLSTKKKR